MAQSLSAATCSEIERVTRLCQRLEFFVAQPPLKVQALSQGESNQSYYVKTAQGEYVLRCYPADSVVCRQQELRCQHAAAAKGLAPAPLCLNNHYQVMLSDYIAGTEPFDYRRHGSDKLLATLAQFHQLSVQTARLDYQAYLLQLAAAVDAENALLNHVQLAAKRLNANSADTVLCHLDLHQGNILARGAQLWLLDFEYSQQADSCLDLAAIVEHFNLDDTAAAVLVHDYAKHRATAELEILLLAQMPQARLVYAGFCWLWYLAMPGCQQQAQHWQQRVTQLSKML